MFFKDLAVKYEIHYLPSIITCDQFRAYIRTLLSMGLGELDVDEIAYPILLRYRKARQQAGLAKASVNKELACLASILRWGRLMGYTENHPKVPREKEGKRLSSLTEEQIQKLIDSAPNKITSYYIALLFITGQRKDAVQKLKRKQIIDNVIEFEKDGYAKADRRKRRARTPVTPELQRILDALRQITGDTEYVFPGRGGIGHTSKLDQWFKEAAAGAGIAATAHVIRHSSATIAIGTGASLYEVSVMLGHSKTTITEDYYVKRRPEHIVKTVGTLGGLVKC